MLPVRREAVTDTDIAGAAAFTAPGVAGSSIAGVPEGSQLRFQAGAPPSAEPPVGVEGAAWPLLVLSAMVGLILAGFGYVVVRILRKNRIG